MLLKQAQTAIKVVLLTKIFTGIYALNRCLHYVIVVELREVLKCMQYYYYLMHVFFNGFCTLKMCIVYHRLGASKIQKPP